MASTLGGSLVKSNPLFYFYYINRKHVYASMGCQLLFVFNSI